MVSESTEPKPVKKKSRRSGLEVTVDRIGTLSIDDMDRVADRMKERYPKAVKYLIEALRQQTLQDALGETK